MAAPERAGRPDALLLGPPSPALPGPGLVRSLDEELTARLRPLVAGLGGGRVLVDAHASKRAHECPAQLAAPRGPFAWNQRLALRRFGVEALRSLLTGAPRTPAEAVLAVGARLASEGAGQPASRSAEGWFASLTPGARASVVAAVTTWVTGAWADLPPGAGALGFRSGEDDRDWVCPGHPPVVLRGRAELRAWASAGGSPRRVVITVAAGCPSPTSEAALRLLALATTLADGQAPARAVALHPEAGDRRVLETTEAVLREAADEAVDVVSALAAARRAGELAHRPGRHCGWCARRDDCPEGTTWLAEEGLRRYGILPRPS